MDLFTNLRTQYLSSNALVNVVTPIYQHEFDPQYEVLKQDASCEFVIQERNRFYEMVYEKYGVRILGNYEHYVTVNEQKYLLMVFKYGPLS